MRVLTDDVAADLAWIVVQADGIQHPQETGIGGDRSLAGRLQQVGGVGTALRDDVRHDIAGKHQVVGAPRFNAVPHRDEFLDAESCGEQVAGAHQALARGDFVDSIEHGGLVRADDLRLHACLDRRDRGFGSRGVLHGGGDPGSQEVIGGIRIDVCRIRDEFAHQAW